MPYCAQLKSQRKESRHTRNVLGVHDAAYGYAQIPCFFYGKRKQILCDTLPSVFFRNHKSGAFVYVIQSAIIKRIYQLGKLFCIFFIQINSKSRYQFVWICWLISPMGTPTWRMPTISAETSSSVMSYRPSAIVHPDRRPAPAEKSPPGLWPVRQHGEKTASNPTG